MLKKMHIVVALGHSAGFGENPTMACRQSCASLRLPDAAGPAGVGARRQCLQASSFQQSLGMQPERRGKRCGGPKDVGSTVPTTPS